MAWIESHDDIWDHHKTVKLTRLLKIGDAQAVGHLMALWHFVLRNAWRDANLAEWGDDGIEFAARWKGPSGELVAALRAVGYLDDCVAHGWMERAGKLVQDRLYNETRRRIATDETQKNAVIRRKADATLPNPTVPNPTVPNPTNNGGNIPKHRAFDVPSVEEVAAYCLERKNTINAQKFCDHYEARGWMIGKNKMKSWKAAVRTWEQSGFNTPTKTASGGIKAAPGKYGAVGVKEGCDGF